MRANRNVGCEPQRRPEKALRQKTHRARPRRVKPLGLLAIPQRTGEFLDRFRIAIGVERLQVQVVRSKREPPVAIRRGDVLGRARQRHGVGRRHIAKMRDSVLIHMPATRVFLRTVTARGGPSRTTITS